MNSPSEREAKLGRVSGRLWRLLGRCDPFPAWNGGSIRGCIQHLLFPCTHGRMFCQAVSLGTRAH